MQVFFSGSLTLPHGLIQHQLHGQDIGGTPFTHIVPNSYITFDTPLLQVKLKGTPVSLNPGKTSLIRIGISNLKSGPKYCKLMCLYLLTPLKLMSL